MKDDLKLLGLKVRDVVTGVEGIVVSICYDLYGCVQGLVSIPSKDEAKVEDNRFWYDTKRLNVIDAKPVMEQPTFAAVAGGEYNKPLP